MTDISTASRKIVDICRRLNAKGLLAAADGNISVRISTNRLLITPSGVNKAFLRATDMAMISNVGAVIHGKPSSEYFMHLEIYRRCPKARTVIHAHPPCATAWSIAFPSLKELPSQCLSEIILAAGSIPIVPYARSGTIQMGENLRPFLPSSRLMILARHGALCWGEDLDEAYNGIERLEHIATTLRDAKLLGGRLTHLPKSEVKALRAMRKKLGSRIL